MKHRERQRVKEAIRTCLEAGEGAVENLESPIIREEVKKLRSMARDR